MTDYELGQGQIRVLRVLWQKKRANTNEIIDILNEHDSIKRSTVQTFLRALVRKGLVGYDVDGRTFEFYPLVTEKEVKHHAFRGFLEHIFEGSMEGLVSYMIDDEELGTNELDTIKKLVDDEGETKE